MRCQTRCSPQRRCEDLQRTSVWTQGGGAAKALHGKDGDICRLPQAARSDFAALHETADTAPKPWQLAL